MDKARTLLVLAAPRTGSNNLITLFNAHPGIRQTYEIFHPKKAYSIKEQDVAAINSRGHNFPEEYFSEDKEFARFRRQEAVRFLDILAEDTLAAGYPVLLTKIFRGQLEEDTLKAVINRPNTAVLVLYRNPLDMVISRLKASITNRYTLSDTTTLVPELTIPDLKSGIAQLTNWFTNVNALTKDIRDRGVFSYEDLFGRSQFMAIRQINSFLESVGMTPEIPAYVKTRLTKQDKAKRWQDKISNPDEIEAWLKAEDAINSFGHLFGQQ